VTGQANNNTNNAATATNTGTDNTIVAWAANGSDLSGYDATASNGETVTNP
jgi:hypothetical protein